MEDIFQAKYCVQDVKVFNICIPCTLQCCTNYNSAERNVTFDSVILPVSKYQSNRIYHSLRRYLSIVFSILFNASYELTEPELGKRAAVKFLHRSCPAHKRQKHDYCFYSKHAGLMHRETRNWFAVLRVSPFTTARHFFRMLITKAPVRRVAVKATTDHLIAFSHASSFKTERPVRKIAA